MKDPASRYLILATTAVLSLLSACQDINVTGPSNNSTAAQASALRSTPTPTPRPDGSCPAFSGNCDANPANGCEIDLGTDAKNCGACGHACSASAGNTLFACVTSRCVPTACQPGWKSCKNLSNPFGCETNTLTDRLNCGACGQVCKGSCSGGVCIDSCTFSDAFTGGATATAQCSDWNTFRACIQAANAYTKVTIKGSFDAVGVACTGATANTLCQGLRTGTAVSSLSCDGRNWRVGSGCGSGGPAPVVELSADGLDCSCGGTYDVRPCIGNSNWGGANTATCSGPSQTITVVCE